MTEKWWHGDVIIYSVRAWEHCRTSPPRFLAECCKKRLNQGGFVLLCFALFALSGLCLVCVLSVLLMCLLSRIFQHEPTWMTLYSLLCWCAVKNLLTLTHMMMLWIDEDIVSWQCSEVMTQWAVQCVNMAGFRRTRIILSSRQRIATRCSRSQWSSVSSKSCSTRRRCSQPCQWWWLFRRPSSSPSLRPRLSQSHGRDVRPSPRRSCRWRRPSLGEVCWLTDLVIK